MDGTFPGDLHQPGVLLCGERSSQLDIQIDPVEHALLRFAFLAVFRVNARMPQRDGDVLERNLFLARIQADGHGGADAERGKQVIVGTRRGIASAITLRLVRAQVMPAANNFLEELARVSPNDDIGRRRTVRFGRRRGGRFHTAKLSAAASPGKNGDPDFVGKKSPTGLVSAKFAFMKLFFLLVLGACLLASPLRGQTSPAAAAPKTSPSESGAMTKDERDRAVEYLKQTQKEFLASIAGVSEAQWKFKAGPDHWSIAETAEHIAVTEKMIWDLVSGKIMKSPAAPEKRAEVKGKDEIILTKIPDRSRKAQAPEQLKPTGKWATQAALVKDFEATRGAEI